jgi:hypothetical protein
MSQHSQVCLTVINAHPADYVYSLSITVDTTTPRTPEFPAPFQSLLDLFKAVSKLSVPTGRGVEVIRDPLADYLVLIQGVQNLQGDDSSAIQAAKASDQAEVLSDVDASPPTSGYRRAQLFLRDSLKADSFHFNDPKLEEHLAAAVASARTGVKSSALDETTKQLHLTVIDGLEALIAVLLAEREHLRESFTSPGKLTICGEVGAGPTAMALNITPKDGGYGSARDTIVRLDIVVRPPYPRSTVSIHPVAIAAISTNVPEFAVDNGTLRAPVSDGVAYRVGAFLNINLASFGPDRVLGAGLGAGVGVFTQPGIISDLFLGTVLSYRDAIRVGFGVGLSAFPHSVKGVAVGSPFPPDAGKLDDLVENKMKQSLQLLLVLPGFKFGR